MHFRTLFSFFVLLCLIAPRLTAQVVTGGKTDSLRAKRDTIALGSAEVKTYRHRSALKAQADGTLRWQLKDLALMPQILGNADPLQYTHFLPGVQTNNEYEAGMHIHGGETSHNQMDIEETPLYNVNHLLGLFSTFHPDHFEALTLRKEPAHAADPNRLGGTLSMLPRKMPADSLEAQISVSLIASQASLQMPIGEKVGLVVSGRASYLNLLYRGMLKNETSRLRYGFDDLNATLIWRPHPRHLISLEGYTGDDRGRMDHYMARIDVDWGNDMAQLRWDYEGERLAISQSLSVTHYANRFHLDMEAMDGKLPSSITDWGYRFRCKLPLWDIGTDVVYHRIRPQSLHMTDDFHATTATPLVQEATEAALFAERTQPLGGAWQLGAGLRASLLALHNANFAALDPSAALRWQRADAECTLSYALRHQYLHQTGFTNVGFPTEYWIAASDRHRPQYAHTVALSAATNLARRRYRLSGEIFWKRLYHQMEYNGSLFDFVSQQYEPDISLLQGKGTNWGASLMVQKCSGQLTGWVGYTYTHARRRFVGYAEGREFPASHERPHELNALATWKPSGHWSYGATLTAASGTPFTAPRSVSLLNSNLIVDYGPHNANRLPAYFRLDLSANYHWTGRKGLHHSLNFSLYNATNRRNALFYALTTDKTGVFAYQPMTFLVGILPSVGYALAL